MAVAGLALGVALLFALVLTADLSSDRLFHLIATANPWTIPAFVALSTLAMTLATAKWRRLWRLQRTVPPNWGVMMAYSGISNLAGQFLPKALGPLLVKTLAMRHHGATFKASVAVSLLDKVVDTLAIASFLPAVVILLSGGAPAAVLLTLAAGIVTSLALVATSGTLLRSMVHAAAYVTRRHLTGEQRALLHEATQSRQTVTVFALATARLATLGLRVAALATLLGIAIPALAAGLLTTVAQISAGLGVTPAGLGVFEAVWFAGSRATATDAGDVVALLLVLRGLQVVTAALLAGVFTLPLVVRRRRAPKP